MSDTTLQREVRARLQGYLLGSESLAVFHDWFVRSTSEMRRAGRADATVLGIELRLAEYKRGHWSEPQLRGRLRQLVPDTLSATQATSEPWAPTGREDEAVYTDSSGIG
jgi:hypothetical protein